MPKSLPQWTLYLYSSACTYTSNSSSLIHRLLFITVNPSRIFWSQRENYYMSTLSSPTPDSTGCGAISFRTSPKYTCRGQCNACREWGGPCCAIGSWWRKNRQGRTVTTILVSFCIITSPWSRLFSHHGHSRKGKKKWHNFLHFSTSVPHLTAIQTDLVRFSAPAVEIVNRPFSLCC